MYIPVWCSSEWECLRGITSCNSQILMLVEVASKRRVPMSVIVGVRVSKCWCVLVRIW